MNIFAQAKFLLAVGFCALPMTVQPLRASLIVSEWLVSTGLHDDQSNSPSVFSNIVQNPFQATHTAALGNSFSTADYDFAWAGDNASFHVDVQHRLASMDGQSGSSGSVRVIPSVDSLVTVNSSYSFAWPGSALGVAQMIVNVADVQTQDALFSDGKDGGNLGLGPPYGLLEINGSAVLAAGTEYQLGYLLRIIVDPTPPGTFADASGQVTFTLAPIPEPAALAPILLTALALRRARNPARRT